ncbi:uncharacterized protein K452DRAFT_243282 [Aplosporella prunicola CBS 121167]|uniref:DNA polymerase epsilon subunit D n=1 Tax=Aplosporella prunicola CBS 121167 TaxID=1176127 RepID=A0A6A6BPW7_9PEZI|nr:uncharacterized protein K452DRAFT_243282 [Aplosporella prunicola CBS 121167]KAF2145345.1 hypothetical protein K452DRAFT_243282 [Aplosporella prunicola CBS 121167]
MPARKSNASVMSAEDQGLSVEDLNLPKTMVNRLAKGALPANTNLQSIAQAAISKSATVFVNYLTSHASDVAARQNKKTIQPKDVLEALKEIEFEQFTERVDRELQRYNTIQCDKRNTYRRKVKEEKRDDMNAPHNPDAPNGAAAHAPPHHAHDGEPVAKRARRDSEEGEGDDTLGDEHEQEEEEEEGEDEGDEEAEDEGDEDEDENEGEGEDGEREDLLEEKEEREEQDEALDEGEESD